MACWPMKMLPRVNSNSHEHRERLPKIKISRARVGAYTSGGAPLWLPLKLEKQPYRNKTKEEVRRND